MEQHTGSQYDDDLTVGMDEYDDSLQTGSVDLFEFLSDKESPITRLKELVLSIDWEITDDILRQFNIELLDLRDIWANDKINLVYVQVLEKISRYIYKEKANSNPNAIKLLLRFYSNLEKIVSTAGMPEDEKKSILLEDVEIFEKFKRQISRNPVSIVPPAESVPQNTQETGPDRSLQTPAAVQKEYSDDSLLNLKAIVFGMDWEITENELIDLGEEVRSLEKLFANSKAKLIILQGIGALGAYINLKRSNAHVDAFRLLHSFFLTLEEIVTNGLSGEEEKKILMPEVEKFNAFKAIIAPTISAEAIAEEPGVEEDEFSSYQSSDEGIVPAFADLPEDVHGFREDEESVALDYDSKTRVHGQIEKFFGDGEPDVPEAPDGLIPENAIKDDLLYEMESRLNGLFGEDSGMTQGGGTSEEIVLQGVDVETEADDDADEEALPHRGSEPVPALTDNFSDNPDEEPAVYGGSDEQTSDQTDFAELTDVQEMDYAAGDKGDGENVSVHLQGVDVETEADIDFEEEPLPLEDEEFAPALFAHDDVSKFEDAADAESLEESAGIEKRLQEFFGDDAENEPEASGSIIPEEPVVEFAADTVHSLDQELPILNESDETDEIFTGAADIAVAQEETAWGDTAAGPEEGFAPLQGTDVETEADEDFEEEPLPLENEELAPALFAHDDVSEFQNIEEVTPQEELAGIEKRLQEFFGDDAEIAPAMSDSAFSLDTTAELEDSKGAEEEEPSVIFLAEDVSERAEPDSALQDERQREDDTDSPGAADGLEADDLEADELETADLEANDTARAAEFEDHLREFFEPVDDESTTEEISASGQGEEEADGVRESITLEDDSTFMMNEETLSDSEAVPEKAEALLSAGDVEEQMNAPFILQDDEDFIDYIEGVEFDLVEESDTGVHALPEREEEVVFQAVDEEDILETKSEMQAFVDEIEKEFSKYFIDDGKKEKVQETAPVGMTEEIFGASDIFGQGFDEEQELTGLSMNVHPEPQKTQGYESLTDESFFAEIEKERAGDHSPVSGAAGIQKDDGLDTLRVCLAALNQGAEERVVESFLDEINRLNSEWAAKPIDKTFLQLMDSIVRYIDQYRYEASLEAHGLLLSVFNGLEKSRIFGASSEDVQESICAETSKVLQWQQKLLIRKNSEAGNTRTTAGRERAESMTGSLENPSSLDTETVVKIVRNEFDTFRQSINDRIETLFRQRPQ